MEKKKSVRQLNLFTGKAEKRRHVPKLKKLGYDRPPTWQDH